MADTALGHFTIGQGKAIPTDHSGPASYVTGGETLGQINNQTGITTLGLAVIDIVIAVDNTISGNYGVLVQPVGKGEQKTFKLIWVTATAGIPTSTQVTAGTNLSGETIKLLYIGR
jgi:hypothetical protein